MAVGGLATAEEIARTSALAREHGRLGIDTEFMSEGRYRALLCLVQVAVDDPGSPTGTHIVLIDPLADPDLDSLPELLADPAVEIILHAGRQDVAILRRAWQTEITNIFDTQISAGFAGGGAQTGYGNLIGSVLGLRVGKTASYTRWDARPLSGEQLRYAAEDVVHLLQLADELQRRLTRVRAARVGARGVPPPRGRDRRARSVDGLGAAAAGQRTRSRGPARSPVSWRPGASGPRPPRTGRSARCSPTRPLVELAKRQPDSTRGIEQIRGIHPPTVRRRGEQILAAIRAGMAAEPIPREESRGRSEAADAPLIALAEALLRARSLEAGLAYELIASRSELEQIVGAVRRGEPEPDGAHAHRLAAGARRR